MARRSAKQLQTLARGISLALALAGLAVAGFIYGRAVYRAQAYNELIAAVAVRARHNDDFKYLVKAVVRRESAFDAKAYGRAGEVGLMQVTAGAAQDWARATKRANFNPHQLWNPEINLSAGSWYLARALRRWEQADDPIPFALAEYNAGLGNVRKWQPADRPLIAAEFRHAITYPGVREYVDSVMRYYREYREAGPWESDDARPPR